MNTCGECLSFQDGKCISSGFLGCSEEDLLRIKETDPSCESFSEID